MMSAKVAPNPSLRARVLSTTLSSNEQAEKVKNLAKQLYGELGRIDSSDRMVILETLSTSKDPKALDAVLSEWMSGKEQSGHRDGIPPNWGARVLHYLHNTNNRGFVVFTTAVLSGLINAILGITFNCVHGTLFFETHGMETHIPIGYMMCMWSSMVSGLAACLFSKCPISIAGPNITFSIVFGPLIAASIATDIAKRHGDDADSLNVAGAHRALSEAENTTLSAAHDLYGHKLLPTVLFAMQLCTLLFALAWYTMGRFRMTRVVQHMPAFVISGFIAGVGWLTMAKAIFLATGWHVSVALSHPDIEGFGHAKFWYLLAPAFCIGVALWSTKQFHLGKPLIVLPCLLIIPLACFFLILGATGYTTADARAGGWFLAEFPRASFTSVYGSYKTEDIQFSAALTHIDDLLVVVLIVTIDALLKLVAIKRDMDTPIDYDEELKLAGKYLVLCAANIGPNTYTKLKFTAVNHGIIHNNTDRLPGIVYVMTMSLFYFWGFPVINYLPRFFLGALVIFAGFSFIYDNLVKTYGVVPTTEYLAIWVCMIVTALIDLVHAVAVGMLMALVLFAYEYGRRSVIKAITTGTLRKSRVVRTHRDQKRLSHMGQLVTIIELHRFLFFGSVVKVQEVIKDYLDNRMKKNRPQRERFLLIDFAAVDGLDHTSVSIFLDIAKQCGAAGLTLVVSGVAKQWGLEQISTWPSVKVFPDGHEACEYIEESMLLNAAKVRQRWLVFDSLRDMHLRHVQQAKFDAFHRVLGDSVGDKVWKYVEKEEFSAGSQLCKAGEFPDRLYVLQAGRVTAYLPHADGTIERQHTMTWGAYINLHSFFQTVPSMHTVEAQTDCIVLFITRDRMQKMKAEHPDIAMQIMETALLHTAMMSQALEEEAHANEIWDEHHADRHISQLNSLLRKSSESRLGRALTRGYRHREISADLLSPRSVEGQVRLGSGQVRLGSGQVRLGSGAHPVGRQGSGVVSRSSTPSRSSSISRSGSGGSSFFHHIQMPSSPVVKPETGFAADDDDEDADFSPMDAMRSQVESMHQLARLRPSVVVATKRGKSSRKSLMLGLHLMQRKNDLGSNVGSRMSIAEDGPAQEQTPPGLITGMKDSRQRNSHDPSETHEYRRPKPSELHLSRNMINTAVQCFRSHLDHDPLRPRASHESVKAITQERLRLPRMWDALMALGKFPSEEERALIYEHLKYKRNNNNNDGRRKSPRARAGGKTHFVTQADFVSVLQLLELEPLAPAQIKRFSRVYYHYAGPDGTLTATSLNVVMQDLGHPVTPLELQQLVRRWDVEMTGYLDVVNFVSMISSFIKKDRKEKEVEVEFGKFAELDGNPVTENSVIHAGGVIKVMTSLGLSVSREDAEDMIFEADTDGRGYVTFWDFISMLVSVHEAEIIGENSKTSGALDGLLRQGSTKRHMSASGEQIFTDGRVVV